MTDYNLNENFEKLRIETALKAVVTNDQISLDQRSDHNLNPHNDSYKPKNRSIAEISSDRSFAFADEFLLQQFGTVYRVWLQSNTDVDPDRRHVRRYRNR